MQKLVMLKKTDDFSSVFSFRKRFSSSYLVIHYKPADNAIPRVGFVVAKKKAKLAVERNYMRRVLRELCRQTLTEDLAVDAVIQVQKKFENKEFTLVREEFIQLINKIRQKLAQ